MAVPILHPDTQMLPSELLITIIGKKVMKDDLLSSENVVLLYVFWSSINYSDLYINELSDPNSNIYYTNSDLSEPYNL
ncbi:hypothetical protein RI543_001087 [Arxiozyma heterogenica]|uniref:Uncharacterized protein n=1 Tax=Arxiozyma heterogenica TaxID=278026 RepID=A0AAN7WME9_9SACH|nr:hypothetical protein RI543_001087 [Kazachstania heterogenica]